MDIKGEIKLEDLKELGGNGWNSTVFLGTDPQLKAEFLFKRIKKTTFPDPAVFFEEAQHLYSARHPNILEVKYAFQTEDDVWMAMPYCSRGSLQKTLEERFLTPREVVRWGIDFLTGLNHVHSRKLLHLDVKPANLLFSDAGAVLLADFGCSRAMDEHDLAEPLQTYPLHQVPERFTASKLGIEADIYQAGLTLYRMANGDDMFFSPIGGRKGTEEMKDQKVRNKVNEKIRKGKYPDRSAYLPHIPEALRRLIVKATAVNPDDRFRSAAEMVNALSGVSACLDWVYRPEPGRDVFTLETEANVIEIEVVPAKGSFSVTTRKTVMETGTPRAMNDFCTVAPDRAGAFAAVKKFADALTS